MKQVAMQGWLRSLPPRLPTHVISYSRADDAPTLRQLRLFTDPSDIYVHVRPEQELDYKNSYPELTILPLSESAVNVGKTRWEAATTAHSMGHGRILMLDDDILWFRYMYEGQFIKGKNIGKEKTAHSSNLEQHANPDLPDLILRGISAVGNEALDTHENAVIGGAIKQHMSFSEKNHRTKYVLNGGISPRQVMVWDIGRMLEMGVVLNTDLFGIHGDDIGLLADILAKGGAAWAMPSFAYDIWAEDVNIKRSLLRDAETAPLLHEFEWNSLQNYPIKDYLKETKDKETGEYLWGDVNWRAYHKIHGTEPLVVPWDGNDFEDLL